MIDVMTIWPRQQAIELGHSQAVLMMDSTFGTNKWRQTLWETEWSSVAQLQQASAGWLMLGL
jgi:hypothetical protein